MTCPRCQAENRPQAKFCEQCASPLARTCANCGTQLSPTAKFCPECADPVAEPAPAQPRFGSPESYTPKHLAEKILTSKSALEGERKQVTVLFADLKGSMELLADRDPEEARKLLDPVLERMMEAVHRYEGTVNQVMGDGIMALFGAPLAHEDHAVRACYAALRMQEGVQRYAEEMRRAVGVPIQIRVGLNSGEVVVRSIGSDLHMDYTAVGQTTHLAARMEQAAVPGSIVIPAETLRLAEGYVQVKPLGPVAVKGLEAPIEVYEVTGAGLVRRRMEVAVARGLTRFVGRDAELDQLRRALEQATQGHGQVVGVVGEAGVGKSRLFYEFTHSHRTHGWLILESGSVSYGKATTYLPVIDLLKAYFQMESRDDARKIREKVSGKLVTLDETLMPTLPAVLSLLDVPVEDPHWQDLHPAQRRQRTLDAVKRLLLRESQVQPLCVVFEDLHWIDSETQVVLDSLIESLPSARLLLLVNYRPEYQHGWGSKTYYTQLRIDPLPPESADELLQALLGSDESVQPLKALLIERTEGNPFFLEESVRTLVEAQALVGDRGACCLAKSLDDIRVPPTVQAVLAARIDRLSPEDKYLLQSASVIGEDVPFPLLQAVVEMPEEELRRALSRLQASEFLYETSLFPDLEYTFKHGLTYQVTYNLLLMERRRTLHAKIVNSIERLYPDRLAEQVDRLAHHASRGELWAKAVAYLREAGAKAMSRSAYREAETFFEQACSSVDKLPESPEAIALAIDLRFELRNALLPFGEQGKIFEHIRAAENLAQRLQDPRRAGLVSLYSCINLWMIGDSAGARDFGRNACAIGERLDDLPLKVAGNYYLGVASLTADYDFAEQTLRAAVKLLHGQHLREHFGVVGFPAPLAHSWLAWLATERGDFDSGLAHAREALRISQELGHSWTMIWPHWVSGRLHLIRGSFDEAVEQLERACQMAAELEAAWVLPTGRAMLGHAYALAGQLPRTLAVLDLALSEYRRLPAAWILFPAVCAIHLGEGLLLVERHADARLLAEDTLALTRQRAERPLEAWTCHLLGEILSRSHDRDAEAAEVHYRGGLGRATELGMRPLVARCHLGLGKMHRRTGDRSRAQEHLTTATTMLREMDMRFWLEQAEAELKALGFQSTNTARR